MWSRRHPALAGLYAVLLATVAALTCLGAYLHSALEQSETHRKEKAEAERQAKEELWSSYLMQARSTRVSRQPGQRFAALRAVQKALELPLPQGHSLDELRIEAIGALCLPDLEVSHEWLGLPPGVRRLPPRGWRDLDCR
jgi:hypothetical protein